MNYRVVTTVRNTPEHLNRCLESIAAQQYPDFSVCVVDDASTDDTPDVARAWCEAHGWTFIGQDRRRGALWNQVTAIHALCDHPDDVVVWVDGDDRLLRTDTFQVLDNYYADPAVRMTFGSYVAEPPDSGCSPARPFPRSVIRQNSYRRFTLPKRYGGLGGGHATNHLRTAQWRLLRHLTEADFTDDRGEWFRNTPDVVIMIPCLELAGPGGHRFVSEELIAYTSNLPSAEWRQIPRDVDAVNLCVLRRPPKDPLPR